MVRNGFARDARPRLLCGASRAALLIGAAALALGVSLAGQAGAATVNPVQTITYTLTTANNPITFGSGTNIGTQVHYTVPAVYGGAATNWNVTNLGIISSQADGIQLQSPSTVTNNGIVTGENTGGGGVVISGGGSIVNENQGKITGYSIGAIVGAGGSITNSGNIISDNSPIYGSTAVSAGLGGSVVNQSGGTISGVSYGVVVTAGSVTNAGVITAGSTAVKMSGGGTLTNLAGGLITNFYSNASSGVVGATTITNAGSISVTGTCCSVAVVLNSGGTVTNTSTGTIAGVKAGIYVGVRVPGAITITNAGSITSSDGKNGSAVWSWVGGVVLTNQAGGKISGELTGVSIYGTGSTVTNAGSITGLTGVGLGMGGGIVTNASGGLISGSTAGVLGGSGALPVGSSSLNVDNAGAISTVNPGYGSGVGLFSGGAVINRASGTIKGGFNGVYAKYASATVTNAGTISSTRTVMTVPTSGVALVSGGSVVNATGGVITGADIGVYIGGGGSITNAGTITGGGSRTPGFTNLGVAASVVFGGAGADTLTLQTGSSLNGAAIGSTAVGATNALILQGTGTADNNFVSFNTLNVIGAGLWVLDGSSAVGTTAVNGGDLQIGDAAHPVATLIGNVTVNAGATLSGHGSISGNVVDNGGTVSPGGTIGTLTVSGNYTQTAASVLSIETTPAASSKLVVAGTATLAGTLQFVTGPGFYRKGAQYDFLTAGAIVGSFTTVTATNGADFTISATPGGLVATETAGVFTPVAATANERAIGAAFVNYPVGVSDFDPVADALIGLPTTTQQNAALDRLGGEVDADFLTVARDNVRSFLSGVEDQNAGGGSPKSGPNAAWGYVTGSADTVHGDGNAHGFDQHAGGVVFGGERDLGVNTRLGAAFDYSHSDVSLQGLDQNGSLDTVAGSVYGRQSFGDLFLDAAASVGWDTGKSTRVIAFTGVDRRATGSFDGASVGGLISFGDRIHGPDGLLIEPSISLVGSSVRQGGFTESGATGADLAVDSQTQGSAEALVGARFTKSFPMASGTLNLDGRLDWAHELSNETPTLGESFAAAAGTHFVVAGADPGKDFAVIGAGLTYKASSKLSVFVRYNGGFSQRQSDQSAALGLKYAW